MILILSGSYQGEREFAKSAFPEASVLDKDVSILAEEYMKEKQTDIDSSAEDISSFIISSKKDIVFCRIMGCGVVPADEKNRILAELVGRTSCILAKQADEVWVVRAGIGSRIQ